MGLVNQDLYSRVKAYFFAQIFEVAKAQEGKQGAKEFMKYIKDNMPKDLSMDTSTLQKELDILDLAKRVANYEAKRADIEVSLVEAQ